MQNNHYLDRHGKFRRCRLDLSPMAIGFVAVAIGFVAVGDWTGPDLSLQLIFFGRCQNHSCFPTDCRDRPGPVLNAIWPNHESVKHALDWICRRGDWTGPDLSLQFIFFGDAKINHNSHRIVMACPLCWQKIF